LWEINFFRLIKRNGESITWNFVDKNKFGWLNQAGEMHGMHGINPPLRLSLMPYFSTYYNKGDFSFKGGLDLKYGLNESFTLDMMLIPDFGQTRADDAVLNLTSVETKYDEKRQFFTEGTELFNKGDLFYSRRIGGQPRNYDKIYSQLAANETVKLNPSETNLYNATKISGHTSSGWGLGFLNAVTKQQTAQIKDTITGQVRTIVTQGVSNYNLLVLDKVIGKESYISWTNANVTIPDENHLSNVSGMEFKYNLKNFQISGDAVLSYLRDKPETTVTNQFGHRFNLNFGKTTGAFRYEMYNTLLSKTYNPWDFGYLENNNLISNVLKFQYLRFKPTRHFNDITTELNLNYESLYKPLLYGRFEIDGNIKFLFKSYNYLKFFISATPVEKYDYYEPRVEGWKYKEPTAAYGGAEFSLDGRRRFSFWVNIGYWHASKFDKSSAYLALQPHYRVNDRLSFDYLLNLVHQQNSIGYVAKNAGNDSIYFGRRGILSIENVGTVKLSLSNKSSLNFRLRHYWSNVEYANYYLLQHSGNMQNVELSDNYNVNYCLLNSDMSYTWQFLPGSELSIVWKNYYSTSNQDTKRGFYSSLKNVFSYSQINSISFKIIYYIDYQTIKKRF